MTTTEKPFRFDYTHAWTENAWIVTAWRSTILGDVSPRSAIYCESHMRKFATDTGNGAKRRVDRIEGRFACEACARFGSTEFDQIRKALSVPGSYARRRGFNGELGVIYNSDPTSPSGARAAGAGYDPYCPHAAAAVDHFARVVEPPHRGGF